MRVWFNGRTSAFQAEYVGSIPITRFSYIIVLFYLEINIWWVWHSWLARRIVVPKVEGSNPSTHPVAIATNYIRASKSLVGLSPSGKAPDFDSGIRWFESS